MRSIRSLSDQRFASMPVVTNYGAELGSQEERAGDADEILRGGDGAGEAEGVLRPGGGMENWVGRSFGLPLANFLSHGQQRLGGHGAGIVDVIRQENRVEGG